MKNKNYEALYHVIVSILLFLPLSYILSCVLTNTLLYFYTGRKIKSYASTKNVRFQVSTPMNPILVF
jgi:hypothetical protein